MQVDGYRGREMGCGSIRTTAVMHVDGNRIVIGEDQVYLALNKMPGMLSTMTDELGRPHIGQLSRTAPSGCSTSGGSTWTPRA